MGYSNHLVAQTVCKIEFLAYVSYITQTEQRNTTMTDDTWNPGETDEHETEEGTDDDVGSVVRSRGKRRIEAKRAPNSSARSSGRSFVVRKGKVETGDAEQDE